jgi:hypothetical protein
LVVSSRSYAAATLRGTTEEGEAPGPAVRWRTEGHQLRGDDELLRFGVADLNVIINKAVGDADL